MGGPGHRDTQARRGGKAAETRADAVLNADKQLPQKSMKTPTHDMAWLAPATLCSDAFFFPSIDWLT